MKSFIQSLNFARVLIILCIVGSFPLGYMAWGQQKEIEDLRLALTWPKTLETGETIPVPEGGGTVERLVREIQMNSDLYTRLKKQADAEGMKGEMAADIYIRRVANADNINMGRLDITPSKKTQKGGVVDNIFRIRPDDPKQEYDRVQIANFLFTLEDDSHRVRVTDLKIGLNDTPKPEELPPNNRWTLDCSITVRQAN